MPTVVEFPQNALCSRAVDRFNRRIPLYLAGYALVLGLVLASLVFGPPTMLSGKAEIGSLSAPGCTD